MRMTKTRIYGNWRYYTRGQYVYCWTSSRQYHLDNKYASFVRRMHVTKNAYVTISSKTCTHSTRVGARRRAARLAGCAPEPRVETKPKIELPENHGYCMKCRGSRRVINWKHIDKRFRNGGSRRALVGVCESCGTSVCKFIPDARECPVCKVPTRSADFADYICRTCRYG